MTFLSSYTNERANKYASQPKKITQSHRKPYSRVRGATNSARCVSRVNIDAGLEVFVAPRESREGVAKHVDVFAHLAAELIDLRITEIGPLEHFLLPKKGPPHFHKKS